jgi:hypothetical protein
MKPFVVVVVVIIYKIKNKVKSVRDKEKYMISSSKIIVHSNGSMVLSKNFTNERTKTNQPTNPPLTYTSH